MKHLRTLVIFGLLGVLSGCAYLNANFQSVGDGRVYRAGQMSPEGLERRLEEHSIHTVVSLRGPAPGEAWYRDERAVCDRLGVERYDLPWSKNRLPEPESLAWLVNLYTGGEGPILVHCQGGTHRSGVAAAVYVLVSGGTVEEARAQFNQFFNDAPIGRLLDFYEGSNAPFGRWVVESYPGIYAAEPEAR